MLAAVTDVARTEDVRAEVDEAAERPRSADPLGDDLLVEAVLERHDAAAPGQLWHQLVQGALGVEAFHAQECQINGPSQLRGQHHRDLDAELAPDAVDQQPSPANCLDVLLVPVDQHDLHSGPRQPGADQAADRARPPDDDVRAPRSRGGAQLLATYWSAALAASPASIARRRCWVTLLRLRVSSVARKRASLEVGSSSRRRRAGASSGTAGMGMARSWS